MRCSVPSLRGGGGGASRPAKNSGLGVYDLTFLHVMHLQAHLLIRSLALSGPALCRLVSPLGVLSLNTVSQSQGQGRGGHAALGSPGVWEAFSRRDPQSENPCSALSAPRPHAMIKGREGGDTVGLPGPRVSLALTHWSQFPAGTRQPPVPLGQGLGHLPDWPLGKRLQAEGLSLPSPPLRERLC